MSSELETVEQRLRSFMSQLRTESGILERLVYKHKNQHRRCSYFQYILKVRRYLKLLKSANLEEILDASFVVISGSRPKQKVQLLESLKRKRSGGAKYNFLERHLGVTRLLSQMVEPLLKAAMQISILLAQSFFMKFSVTTLAVLARIRVLVQQMLLDSVLVYNTVSTLSQKEQSVKLNQKGFQVFREYYPRNEEAITILECLWQTDKYVLVEKSHEVDPNSQNKDGQENISLPESKIHYQSIDVLLGVGKPEPTSVDQAVCEEDCIGSKVKIDEQHLQGISEKPVTSSTNVVPSEPTNLSATMMFGAKDKMPVQDGSCTSTETPGMEINSMETSLHADSTDLPYPRKRRKEVKKKVAFVSVKLHQLK